jgi:hypothetical protein
MNVYSSIENKDLHNEIFIQGIIHNKTLADLSESYFELGISINEAKRGDKIKNLKVNLCERFFYPGSYSRPEFNCTRPVNNSPLTNDEGNHVYLYLNVSDLNAYDFILKIAYDIEGILIENGEYKIMWIETRERCLENSCKNPNLIRRYLTLPSNNSILESWNNFKIIGLDSGRWVLEVTGTESMVWYRDATEEQKENRSFFAFGIFVSSVISIAMTLISLKIGKFRMVVKWGLLIICAISLVLLLFLINTKNINWFYILISLWIIILVSIILLSIINSLKGKSNFCKKFMDKFNKFFFGIDP